MSYVPAIGKDTALSIPVKKDNRIVSFFKGMNHSAVANIHEASGIKQYKVPAGLEKVFEWAFKPLGQAKDSLLKKIGRPLVQTGFKFLQMPVISKLSPFVQYNLLFSAGTGLIGSAYNLATGKPTEAVHGFLGNAAVIAANAFASLKIPALLGVSALSGWGALIGFGVSFVVDPIVRKMTGLDKPKELTPEELMQQQMMQQQQQMVGSPLAAQQNPYAYASGYGGGYNQAGYMQHNPYQQGCNQQQPYAYNPQTQQAGQQAVEYLQKTQETRDRINSVLNKYRMHFGKDLSAPPPVAQSEVNAMQWAQASGYLPTNQAKQF